MHTALFFWILVSYHHITHDFHSVLTNWGACAGHYATIRNIVQIAEPETNSHWIHWYYNTTLSKI